MNLAITRRPAPNCGEGLTGAGLGPPDYALLCTQHAAYEAALRETGAQLESLAPLPDHPDAWFVEDTAVITPQRAIITRPGAPPRRAEAALIEPVLARHRDVVAIEAPGTLDGGDVLIVGARAFIGLSARSNRAGAEQLRTLLANENIVAEFVDVGEDLHLKSGVTHAGGDRLLIAPALARHPAFAGFEHLVLDAADGYAANSLYLDGLLLVPAGFPAVCEQLERARLPWRALEVSEVRKMDGGLTCMSLRL